MPSLAAEKRASGSVVFGHLDDERLYGHDKAQRCVECGNHLTNAAAARGDHTHPCCSLDYRQARAAARTAARRQQVPAK